MKKMLTLVLVLAVASLANAAPVWTGDYNDVTGVVSVSITGNTGAMYIGLAITSGSGTLSGFNYGADAPESEMFGTMGAGLDYEGHGEGELWSILYLGTGSYTYTDGEWLTANFSGATPSIATMYAFDEVSEVFTPIGTILIPEPITMALLGVGGLFLRRRK